MDNIPILFAGSSSTAMAEEICRTPHTGILLGSIYHHQFPSGEWYCQLKQNIRGADVFLLQSICQPANDNLMQLLVMADAARRASAGRITAVIPYLGYSRQDRKDKPRVPISSKMVMNILASAGINRFLAMDLHAQQIQGFTDLPFDQLLFQPVLSEALKGRGIEVVVSPDTGAIKKASEFADKAGLDLALIVKERKNDTTVRVKQFVGNVKDKSVLLVDDLTESAGTLIAAAEECRANGASKVYCAVTHGCLTEIGVNRLSKAYKDGIINHFFCSNTAIGALDTEWGSVVSVSPLFAEAIRNIHANESITSLFK